MNFLFVRRKYFSALLLFFLASCSEARSIAQTAEQANRYKKLAAQQIQEWNTRLATESWQNSAKYIQVRLHTTKGGIEVRLAFELSPLATAYFLRSLQHYRYFQREQTSLYVRTDASASLDGDISFPAEFSEWLDFRQPGILAFEQVAEAMVDPSSFVISLEAQPDLFGRLSAFGQIAKGLKIALELGKEDRLLSAKISSDSPEGQQFLEQFHRDDFLRKLRAEGRYKRQGLAAIHQRLARDFAAVQWPRYQRRELQLPSDSQMRDWGLEYKVLQKGSGKTKLGGRPFERLEIQYAVWATQNDGRSLLLEDRIREQQSVPVLPKQLFPAWRAALLDMRQGERR
ncbi:MAG: peptidylprolyl isomerase, partial [Spirochaetota bacterium]